MEIWAIERVVKVILTFFAVTRKLSIDQARTVEKKNQQRWNDFSPTSATTTKIFQ